MQHKMRHEADPCTQRTTLLFQNELMTCLFHKNSKHGAYTAVLLGVIRFHSFDVSAHVTVLLSSRSTY